MYNHIARCSRYSLFTQSRNQTHPRLYLLPTLAQVFRLDLYKPEPEMPKPEIPEPVLDHVCSRQQSDQEPGDGANAVADAVPTTDTSQQLQKERVPLVSQSQDDGRQPAPDPDDQDSKALQSQLSSSDALASLVAAGTAPKKSGRPGRPLKKKRGPKPK